MQPVPILFGCGRIRELKDEILGSGAQKAMLVTSRSFAKKGYAQKIVDESQGIVGVVYSEVSPNPEVTEVQRCVDLVKENRCDAVVALGGGSVIDLAKIVSVAATTDDPVDAYMSGTALPKTHLPLIAVPTTAGTGSEVTCVAVLSDHEKGLKKPLSCDAFYPVKAIVDPELTVSVPPYVTACTGIDALCQAIEAYWNVHHQPVCDALAVCSAKIILQNLRTVFNEPDNITAREEMAKGSLISGLAFSLPKTTSAHACSYPLTNLLGIAHGEAVALTIDYFMDVNTDGDSDGRIQKFAEELGFKDGHALADELRSLKKDLNLRSDLKSFCLSDEMFERLIKDSQNGNLLNNPTEITEDMLRNMYGSMC